MEKPIRCYLKTIAPIHLGCDEVYEPLGFVMEEERCQLIVFEPWSFFRQLGERDKERFSELCKKGTISSLLEIYQFLRRLKTSGRAEISGRAVAVCPGLVKHYQRTLQLPLGNEKQIQQELNNFTIARTAFLSYNERPFIPGSAIKGALRTAYLNYLAQRKKDKIPKETVVAKELEKFLLDGGSFDTDPFRMLKVSDFMPVGEVKTKIIYAVNEKKKPSNFPARGPYQILEVIEPGAIFTGSILIQQPEKMAGIITPLRRQRLLQSARSFYQAEKSREDRELSEVGIKSISVPDISSGSLLRLGRHSGAESVTIADHRNIKIMQGRGENPKFQDQATTFWLAAEESNPPRKGNLRPFGWVVLEEISAEQENIFTEREAAWRQQEAQKIAMVQGEESEAQPPEPRPEPEPVPTEIWPQASLTWNPGKRELTAAWQNKKAFVQGKALVPDKFHNKLFKKKKAVIAKVTVEPIGNAYRIIRIEAGS